MKSPKQTLALFLIACLAAPAPLAQAAPKQQPKPKAKKVSGAPANGSTAGCDGLSSPVMKKNAARNITERDEHLKKFCGDPKESALAGRLGKQLEAVEKASAHCEEALRKTVSPKFSVSDLFKGPKQRLNSGCVQARAYNVYAREVCQNYTNNVNAVKSAPAGSPAMSTRDAYLSIADGIHKPVKESYKKMSGEAIDEVNEIGKRFPGLKDKRDTIMVQELERAKAAIKFNEEKARKLIETRGLKNRGNLQGIGRGDVRPDGTQVGVLSLKTQADVDNFYKALNACVNIHKKGGELDKWNDEYQKGVAKVVDDGREEAKSFAKNFKDQSERHAKSEAEQRALAEKIDTDGAAGSMVKKVSGDKATAESDRAGRGIVEAERDGDAMAAERRHAEDVEKARRRDALAEEAGIAEPYKRTGHASSDAYNEKAWKEYAGDKARYDDEIQRGKDKWSSVSTNRRYPSSTFDNEWRLESDKPIILRNNPGTDRTRGGDAIRYFRYCSPQGDNCMLLPGRY